MSGHKSKSQNMAIVSDDKFVLYATESKLLGIARILLGASIVSSTCVHVPSI